MAPQDMAAEVTGKKRVQPAWKLRLPWEQETKPQAPKSAFIAQPIPNDNTGASTSSMRTLAKAFFVNPKRLRMDPDKQLLFLYEPGKQVSSAIKIKNISRTPVAFKFQTTAPKSCFMRPPSGVLAPEEALIATVYKFVEPPEHPSDRPQERKTKDKFKIVSLAVKPGIEYTPELFDDQKEVVAVERILQVVYIDPKKAAPELLDKLQRRLAEAEALEASKRPVENKIPAGTMVVEGLVIDEWKQRREHYLAQQQGGAHQQRGAFADS